MSKWMGGVLADVSIERERQGELFPGQEPGRDPLPVADAVLVAYEEAGEVAKGYNEGSLEDVRREAVEAAASFVKLIEIIDTGATLPAPARNGRKEPSGRDLGAAITDPGDDGSGWG